MKMTLWIFFIVGTTSIVAVTQISPSFAPLMIYFSDQQHTESLKHNSFQKTIALWHRLVCRGFFSTLHRPSKGGSPKIWPKIWYHISKTSDFGKGKKSKRCTVLKKMSLFSCQNKTQNEFLGNKTIFFTVLWIVKDNHESSFLRILVSCNKNHN